MAKDGFLRKLWTNVNRPRKRPMAPSLTELEPRTLQALLVGNWQVNIHPAVLPPTNGFIPIHVYGEIASNKPKPPTGFFFVTDEYGTDEPRGNLALGPTVPVANYYETPFSVTFYLQAKRSTNTQDGRHYDIFVGATDADGTAGETVAVYVPKVYPVPTLHTKPKS